MSSVSSASLSSTGFLHMNNLSGIDVDALVSATIMADSIPITLLKNKNTLLQTQSSDYATIKNGLFSLRSALNDLTYNSAYTGRTATTTDATIVTGVSQNGASTGAYVIEVTGLAKTTHATGAALTFADGTDGKGTKATLTGSGANTVGAGVDRNLAFNDPTSPYLGRITAGFFTVNDQRIDVTATDTINTILNKISASGAGVNATIDGSGHVVLTQKTVGATPTVKFGAEGDSSGFLAQVGLNTTTAVAGTDPDQQEALNTSFGAGAITAGYFSINGTYFSVDPTKDTMDSIINKINSSTTAGVLAFYDSTTKQMSLTNQTAGNKNIDLGTSATDSSNFLSKMGLKAGIHNSDGTGGSVVLGEDAAVKVNGTAVTPTNNTVTLNGNTFTINKTGTATVTVQNDTDSIVKKVQAFITAYNTTIDQVNGKLNEESSDSTADHKVGGDLFGDPTLADISETLRSFSYATVAAQPATMQQLSQAGITTGAVGQSVDESKTGHLSLDVDVLKKALQSDPGAVASLFGNSTASVLNEAVGTSDGAKTDYTLKNGSISAAPTIQTVDGSLTTTYNEVTTFSTDAATRAKEYMIDYTTGKITFGTAPVAGATIKASYDYDVSSGNNAGVFVQMTTQLSNYTKVGGVFDSLTGSNGSITQMVKYNSDRIKDLQLRLKDEQTMLYTKYNAMQTLLQSLQSQGSFLTSALSSSSSSK
ncbi:flagellar hook-associated protein 2 [Sporomusaceae bacterium BoRhaA]|uniref:flagellar filament capping protein FliD n=1 Tax=Pelorhabdus rhamnosifermentans TaxID=2772457 RepID=UPI001C060170|nr:flagellar filament capping protein FliD [Pelorhabdus rhamnosifermentans]MBU2699155.1 flagellar hook-associated protein 2 [Pelorhabdus rhamnosifermentans]